MARMPPRHPPRGKLASGPARPPERTPTMRLHHLILTGLIVATFTGSASAFGPRRIGAYNKHAAVAAYGRAMYPKYYWGFHAREFQNVGVPHGDIGVLGSGLSRDPW